MDREATRPTDCDHNKKLSLRENIATSETRVRAMLVLYERKEKEKEANEKEKRGREKDGVEANFYSSEAEYLF